MNVGHNRKKEQRKKNGNTERKERKKSRISTGPRRKKGLSSCSIYRMERMSRHNGMWGCRDRKITGSNKPRASIGGIIMKREEKQREKGQQPATTHYRII